MKKNKIIFLYFIVFIIIISIIYFSLKITPLDFDTISSCKCNMANCWYDCADIFYKEDNYTKNYMSYINTSKAEYRQNKGCYCLINEEWVKIYE